MEWELGAMGLDRDLNPAWRREQHWNRSPGNVSDGCLRYHRRYLATHPPEDHDIEWSVSIAGGKIT